MAVPAYKQTWLFATNTPINPAAGVPQATAMLDNTRRYLFMVKELLLAARAVEGKNAHVGSPGAWSIYACSDGTNVASDGTDLWGTTYTAGKIVRGATAATARSWMWLRKQFGSRWAYILLDFRSDADSRFSIGFSDLEPTNGAAFSTSQNRGRVRANCVRGLSPDEYSASIYGGMEYVFANANIATCPASYLHFGLGDDGSFYIAMTETTTSNIKTLMGFAAWDSEFLTQFSPGAFYYLNYGWLHASGSHVNMTNGLANASQNGSSSNFGQAAVGPQYTGGLWCGRTDNASEPNLDVNRTFFAQRSTILPNSDMQYYFGTVDLESSERHFLTPVVNTVGLCNYVYNLSIWKGKWSNPRGVLKDLYISNALAVHATGALSPALAPYTWCNFNGVILPCAEQPIAGW